MGHLSSCGRWHDRTGIAEGNAVSITLTASDCIRMSVSIFTPKALSLRSAMSPDRPAMPLRKMERAGRCLPRQHFPR